jgi:hypothetical protein
LIDGTETASRREDAEGHADPAGPLASRDDAAGMALSDALDQTPDPFHGFVGDSLPEALEVRSPASPILKSPPNKGREYFTPRHVAFELSHDELAEDTYGSRYNDSSADDEGTLQASPMIKKTFPIL